VITVSIRTWGLSAVIAIWLACVALLGALTPVPGPALAQSTAELRCRHLPGQWQRCQMVLAADGMCWTLRIGQQSIDFRHDGRGQISMRQGKGGWHAVDARWLADASLCWDGICARGLIPLD